MLPPLCISWLGGLQVLPRRSSLTTRAFNFAPCAGAASTDLPAAAYTRVADRGITATLERLPAAWPTSTLSISFSFIQAARRR
jgi:hypothetical protein